MAMPLLILPIAFASRFLKAPGRLRRCGALSVRKLRGWTTAGEARTLVGADGKWVQVDRGALPAQAVFLVGTEDEKRAMMQIVPIHAPEAE
jgi:hypothetical protein